MFRWVDRRVRANCLNEKSDWLSTVEYEKLVGIDNLAPQDLRWARYADAVAFGRLFISNPDLVARIEKGLSLTAHDRAIFYGGGEHGYTDYPVDKEPLAGKRRAIDQEGGLPQGRPEAID